jgi:endonuclease/exonuclease/phosphatase (EEP) superfamily protein YafD
METAARPAPDRAAGPEPERTEESAARRAWRTGSGIGCWIAAAALAVWAITRLFGLERTWYLDALIAYTPYVALLGLLFVPMAVLARKWWALGIAAAATAALVITQIPLVVGDPDPGPGPIIHVLSSNMKIGAADPAMILRLASQHRTDLLALDEYTPAARRAMAAAGVHAMFAYSAESAIPGATGSAIFSRYPLRDTGYRPLAGGFGQEYATVLVPGAQPLAVEAVHTHAPVGPSDDAGWARSLAEEPAATPHSPVRLLIGDFNASLDHRPLRTLLHTGYRDAAAQIGEGLDTTWPYDGRALPPVTLDHVFADRRIGVVRYGTAQIRGSDHKAIYATLTLPPS